MFEDEELASDLEDDDDEPESQNPSETPIPKELKVIMKDMRVNSGHKPKRVLVRALRIAGAGAEVIRAAKAHKCPICDE